MTVTLNRWNPWRDMIAMQERMNRLANEGYAKGEAEMEYGSWIPPVDLREEDHQFVIQMDLPGVKKEDIDIHMENNVLTLRGERRFEKEDEKHNYHRIERFYGKFTRSFTLPSLIQAGGITATFKDGILEVAIPKADESKPKKIAIAG
jgi:HSP20 family protein